MPRTKSAQKALRQNIKRKIANKKKKEKLKKIIKEFKKSCQKKDQNQAKELLIKCYKTLDKSAKARLIHKNKASRLKSRLAKMQKKV